MIIREVIEKIIDQKVVLAVQWGVIKELSEDTCTVISDIDGKEFFRVSLNAVQENNPDVLKITPKINSRVCFGVHSNNKNATILSVSEVDTVYYKKASTEFKIDDKGFEINREGESLKEVLNDFIDEVNKIVVVNGTSINISATTAIQQRLNKILQ